MITPKPRASGWWLEEDGLFNLDDEGRSEKQQCAVAASNIIRNFSFMPDNEVAMGQNRHCLETLFQCLEDHVTEDEELVTNALETIMNLGPLLELKIFSSSKPSFVKMTESRAVKAVVKMLQSSVKAWHCAAAELLGRMILNADNEQFLMLFGPQIYKRLVEMAVDRLLKVIKTPHPMPEICRKATLILENLVSEPQNKPVLIAYENVFADMLFSETRYTDAFARILYELTSRPSNKIAPARGIWGM
ncbi:armadillo repeat-containing protein lfr [Phtheirospermum japonicum]|uniref:Armadillo repeat-containing protein lfr n=1 Tax=Phtheirospermum japonicum TaxID=374723 RepID=A0A830BVC0_9LAMI|nr:armadillo repeat-containing protein lfr [Phtheirospermum japonicum]